MACRFSRLNMTYPVYPDIEERVRGEMRQIFVDVSIFF